MLCNTYYNKLNEQEKKVYDALLNSAKKFQTNTKVPRMPSEKVLMTLHMEHPELFYFDMRTVSGTSEASGILLNNRYRFRREQIQSVEGKVKRITDTLSGTEETTVRLAHNYLVRNVIYDHVSAKSGKYDPAAHSIAGPFLYKSGVCEGIALAFKRLLDEKGIDNATVLGSFRRDNDSNAENHIWSVVSINGANYYIDVTQDIENTDPRWGKPSYLYYMLTEEELGRTHVWSEDFNCNSTNDNPFDCSGRNLHTQAEIGNYISRLPSADKLVCFKCRELSSEAVEKAAERQLFLKGWRAFSTIQNAGRYYIYREA